MYKLGFKIVLTQQDNYTKNNKKFIKYIRNYYNKISRKMYQ